MSAEVTKVGIISCSGEAIPEGTISRLATRRVLELLRPTTTVTLCLPLFLAGNEAERNFAKTHPTITIDGCEKRCAKWGTEEHSGPVSSALVVTGILGTQTAGCHARRGTRPSRTKKRSGPSRSGLPPRWTSSWRSRGRAMTSRPGRAAPSVRAPAPRRAGS